MKKTAITLFASTLLLTWAFDASAQTACEDALHDAEKTYELGLFEDVPTKLSPCLGTPTSRALAVHVHSLLARAYLNNDESDKARKEVSTLLRLQSNYEAEAGSSARYLTLVADVRRAEQTTQVVSVSKTSESLREAPATVVVVTGDEIRRRGYLDLEQLLHDLPGFDIARLNGAIYSTIYQRGYRDSENARLLLLVDGVEQNDLSGGRAYLSRQYPLMNIDRVEVIYGPASTMYGANAYTGVISIVTLDADAFVGEKRKFGLAGQVTSGGYAERSVDVTAAGTNTDATIAWTVATRFQRSGARDLSALDPWDFTNRNFDYKSLMRLPGTPEERSVLCAQPSPYIQCSIAGIELTDQGETLVRGLDRKLIDDNHAGFDDRATNWSVNAKLRIQNLTLGLQSWSSQEGMVSAYGAPLLAGNTTWTPKETALYLKYSIPLERVKLNIFTRFEQTTLDPSKSRFDYTHNYSSGLLSLWSLVAPCVSPRDPQPVNCAPASPWLEKDSFSLLNSEIHSEASITWQPSEKLDAVAGVEFAKGSIQSQFDQSPTGPGFLAGTQLEKPVQNEHTDAAIYGQGSWKPWQSLKFVFAGRLGYNSVDNRAGVSGYGTLFTPRAGAIYSPGNGPLIFKAIYSEAFKDPTDEQKFGVTRYVNEFRSNGLRPERVRNIELSASWRPSDRLSIEGSAYQAGYKNVVTIGAARLPDGSLIPDCPIGFCLQFQNRDRIRVRGLQATATYKAAGFDVWSNYTRTLPVQVGPTDLVGDPLTDAGGAPIRKLKVADIAANQGVFGVERDWPHQLSTALRIHFVGARRTGDGTNYPSPFRQMAPYSTTDATLSYSGLLPHTTLQLNIFNLFGKDYYDPGNQSLPRVLQAGRTIHLRLIYGLPGHLGNAQSSP